VNDTQSMDLILCRNLLIYFTPQHTRQLIANLRRSLVDDGWLIVSPSECSQALFSGFVPVNLPGSILYRKRDRADVAPERMPEAAAAFAGESPAPMSETEVARMLAAPTPPAAPVPVANPTLATLADAEAMYASGRYADTASVLRRSLTRLHDAERLRALALLARSLANQGEIQDALTASEQWLAADKLDPAAHYLNAMVLQELGDRERARTSLQRAVYLQPDFTLAHFALGNHARAGARHAEARKHFENAAHLLRGHAEDEAVAESEGLTAGRLREIITALTSGLDA
jgi:chemotaxis protein methyltransferase CheR